MRIVKLILGLSTLLVLSCSSNSSTTTEQVLDSTRFAELTYIDDFFDAGSVHSGEQVKHSFRFRNTGNAPLVVKDIIPSCGCTKVEVSKKILKPNDEAYIDVIFDSKGWYGSQYKAVTLRTNGVIREKSVTLKVNVIP